VSVRGVCACSLNVFTRRRWPSSLGWYWLKSPRVGTRTLKRGCAGDARKIGPAPSTTANRFFQLLLALLPRPLITQKVESPTLRGVHEAGLGRVQLQTFGFHPALHLIQSGLRFGLAAALDNEVVGRYSDTLLRGRDNVLPLLERRYGPTARACCGAFGCTFGTEAPSACLKCTLERSSSVPRQRSASGNTTLKFLCM